MDDTAAVPLSALQHWAYCPRQCGLIHLEQAFDDNLHTLRGQATHRKVDAPGVETAKGLRVVRAVPLWHDELGLAGKADLVEFAPDGSAYPVEYKQGSRHKAADIAACDELQLAAQAVCLEAMTGRPVDEGAIYYATSKRRRTVPITPTLRAEVAVATQAVKEMLDRQTLPIPLLGEAARQRCRGCSLRERCQPEAAAPASLRTGGDALFDPDAPLASSG
ncbi:MAG TPA: CRISPR-associated protein Cas4 [Methylibium sp.]|uniref:CRISPR-associated protein Cas4 n=1 Tax=Methylibium sp. TaxID=2067992 RepID=UPI002DBBC93A|nr:CRISPR-associated protein Cas4 [Methylibium sp.]HEU4458750.1 CRISPR-associated protein Cas4 [Methylibium sp.]